MNEERNELKAVLRAMAEKHEHSLEAHATLDEVMAFESGKLSLEEKERLREHLAWCRQCLDLLLDATAWAESDQEESSASPDAQVQAAWQAMQARLRQKETKVAPPMTWRQRFGWLFTPAGLPFVVAASLAVLSLALGIWIVSLDKENERLTARTNEQLTERDKTIASLTTSLEQARQRAEESRRALEQLSQPQLNVPIEDLYSQQELTREQLPQQPIPTIDVPAGTNSFSLILHVGDQPSYPDYSLEILDQQNQAVWSGGGLQKSQEEKSFSVSLSRQLVTAGVYRIRLYGQRAGRKQLVGVYALRIQ